MRAVRCTEDGIRVVEADAPAPGGDEVRVRVRAAGICGSDLEMTKFGPQAVTFGHEVAGLLDDGTPVAIQPTRPCGSCEPCRAGAPQQCATGLAEMYGVGRDGGMADELTVRRSCLVPLPEGLEVRDASLVEPLAVALHAFHRGRVEAAMPVAVVGAGTIGLTCTAVGTALDVPVTVAARHSAQQQAVEALRGTLDPSGRYEVVFEASGSESGFARAIELCARGGTIVLVATYWWPMTVALMSAQMKELTLVPAFVYGHAHGEREIDAAARILAGHPVIASTLVTHRFPLDAAAEAFRVAADRAAGAIKVVLEP